jgi:predicted permease
MPASGPPASDDRAARTLSVVGRLADGAALPRLRTEMERLGARLALDHPATNKAIRFTARTLREDAGGGAGTRTLLLTLMAAVAVVLVIACANVASLLIARSAARAREVAIRTALGATRWRIVRQLLIECAVLAGLGGALGILLSGYGARMLAVGFDVIDPGTADTTPYWVDLSMNGSAYAFVGMACLFATIAFGLAPALLVSRTDVNGVLKDTGRAGSATRRVRRWTSAFVVAEIALTLALLTSAGLLWRSFLAKYRSDLVIVDPSRLVTMRVLLPAERYPTAERREEFAEQLDERLASLPGAAAATLASVPPIGWGGSQRQLAIEGQPPTGDAPPAVSYALIGSRYFETIGLPIIRGRALDAGDSVGGREGAIVNERVVALFFADRDPIGRRIRLVDARSSEPASWITIVGVARAVPMLVGPSAQPPIVYVPYGAGPAPDHAVTILVRDAPLAQASSAVRAAVGGLDPSLPVYGIERLAAAVARGRYPQWLLGSWLGMVAGIAVVMAAVGLYALTAHGVAQRTQEIGLCMALGASRRRILWTVVRGALARLAVGLVLGFWGALSVGRLFQAFLVEVSPRDAATLAMVTAVLVVVSLFASLIPARRAARIDPMAALRCE